MNNLKPNRSVLFNPPLRIFTPSTNEVSSQAAANSRFERPKIKRLVEHERIARYFTRRGVSLGSPLD